VLAFSVTGLCSNSPFGIIISPTNLTDYGLNLDALYVECQNLFVDEAIFYKSSPIPDDFLTFFFFHTLCSLRSLFLWFWLGMAKNHFSGLESTKVFHHILASANL
jgi:hypothetical protein